VRTISSPGSIGRDVCFIYAITGASGLGTWAKRSVAPVLAID